MVLLVFFQIKFKNGPVIVSVINRTESFLAEVSAYPNLRPVSTIYIHKFVQHSQRMLTVVQFIVAEINR